MEELVRAADELAREEIRKHGLPSVLNFETSNAVGERLAMGIGADLDTVRVGTRLMDLKLGEAASKERVSEHVAMSVDASREFLSRFDIPEEMRGMILNCVAGHHGTEPWACREAEVCANADCYRFLLTRNWLAFLHDLGKRGMPFDEALQYADEKANEKWGILSIEACRRELEPHFTFIQRIVRSAR